MFIESLVLSGNKLLQLRGIKHLELSFTEIHQLILGTNGCGKSSLLRELSPLPADAANYAKGGYKHIRLSHKGVIYTIASEFQGKPRHSIKIDELELNAGGTATVQRELVSQLFNLDDDLFDVLVGDKLFEHMDMAVRRKWLMRLASADLDYAMQLYNKLRKATKDAAAVAADMSKRLNDETLKIVDDSELVTLREHCDMLKQELRTLLLTTDIRLPAPAAQDEKLRELLEIINVTSRRAMQLDVVCPPNYAFTSIDEVTTAVVGLQLRLKTVVERQTTLHAAVAKVSKIVSTLRESHSESMAELDAKCLVLHNQAAALRAQIKHLHVIKEVPEFVGRVTVVATDLMAMYMDLPDNRNRQFNRQQVDTTRARIDAIRQEQTAYEVRLSKLAHRLEHLSNLPTTKCPQCSFTWQENTAGTDRPALEAEHKALTDAVSKLRHEYTALEHYMAEVRAYTDQRRHITRVISDHPDLHAVWLELSELETAGGSRAEITALLQSAIDDARLSLDIYRLDVQIAEYEATHQLGADLDGAHHAYNSGRLAELQLELEQETQTAVDVQQQLQILSGYQQRLQMFFKLSQQVEECLCAVEREYQIAIAAKRNAGILELTGVYQSMLAHSEQLVNRAAAITAVIAELQQASARSILRHQGCALLTSELSPVDGVIADQMREGVSDFVTEMNTVIGQIWSHDFELLPCGTDGGELDYKFPISVMSGNITSADVSKASTAQRHVINFAFRLVVMQYLDLSDLPLYLDELGASFDPVHRQNCMQYIKAFIDGRYCSQAFMINHYHSEWGAFVNAQVLVLDAANILHLPGIYNKHAVIQ